MLLGRREPAGDALDGNQKGVRIHVPFKYDLGGQVKDVAGIRNVLLDLYGTVEVDQATARSWNLSYLACHPVVLRCPLPGGTAKIADSEWHYERSLRIFPWLGVLSVDYEFEARHANANILHFYDGLVEWKNADYLSYLQECNVMTEELIRHTALTSSSSAHDLHASLVRGLRGRAQPYISPRPALYAFHDFRVCFIDIGSALGANIVQCLLWLTTPAPAVGLPDEAETLKFGSVEISSTGWSTVLRINEGAVSSEIATCISLLHLAHAQWFVCQSWINIYDPGLTEAKNVRAAVRVHELSACRLSLARDLSEVGNFEAMLKDPNLLRVARTFERSFSVLAHRNFAEQRLRIPEDHSRNLTEYATERTARRLAVLFGLSAAGTVAALVPALVQIGVPALVTLITIFLLVALWLGFTINFAVFIGRLSIPRQAPKRTIHGKETAGKR